MNRITQPDPSGVSIIVLNHNGKEFLKDCLGSLQETDYPGSLEIILLDNGSTDGSTAMVKRIFPDIRLIPLNMNRGFAGGNNTGCEQAGHDIVALVNSDTRVHPDWLGPLVAPIFEGRAGCTAGKILKWDGTKLDFGRGIVTFDGHAFQLDAGKPVRADAYNREEEIFFACGGCMAVRKDLFLKSGGFDKDYFAYFEDVDFGWRLQLMGEKILFVPGSLVYHRGSGTSSRMDPFDRGFLFEKNAFMTVVKNLGEKALREFLPAVLMTLLHRTYCLTAKLADKKGILTEYPYLTDQENIIGKKKKGEKLWEARGPRLGKNKRLTLTHPHSLSQLRALDYIFKHLDRILEKRKKVQAMRRRPDEEIFERFRFHLIPTYPGDENLFRSDFFRELLKPEGIIEKTLQDIQS